MTSPDGFIPGTTNTGWDDVEDMAAAFINEQGGLLGLIGTMAEQWINQMIHDLLDRMDGATGGVFNLDDLADRLYGTERGLQTNVPRLDNRIDEIIIGNMQAQLATFATTDIWYKPTDAKFVKVDVIGGASGGGRPGSALAGAAGGYSGGWASFEFNAADLPNEVLCTVGPGGAGATSDGGRGASGGLSSFGTFLAATGGNSVDETYGAATNPLYDRIFHIRGGKGQQFGLNPNPPMPGGDGTFSAGAIPPEWNNGDPGADGASVGPGQIGMGAGASGGAAKGGFGSGGRGGHGGWPSGPGGGGGAYETFGLAGNGGNGAGGAVFVTTRFY